jgi:IS30 family transposase
MGNYYGQLSLDERIELDHLKRCGLSLRQIGDRLGRAASTISRELRRNSKRTKQWIGGYRPTRAHGLAERRRRWDARFKLSRQPLLRSLVHDHLAMGWSPEQIAGRLAHMHGHTVISHESIYRFIYHRTHQNDYWNRLLTKKKYRRGSNKRGWINPVDRIKRRVSVHKRGEEANNRSQKGHWEADLMLFAKYGQAVLVTQERYSRYLKLTRSPNKKAQLIVDELLRQFQCLPKSMRRSVTFDNGTEFSFHHQLNDKLGMETYFCDIRAPWQKGGVENAIGRIRRMLPRKTDIATIEAEKLQRMVQRYNETPRKCLAYKTPKEVYKEINETVALVP